MLLCLRQYELCSFEGLQLIHKNGSVFKIQLYKYLDLQEMVELYIHKS